MTTEDSIARYMICRWDYRSADGNLPEGKGWWVESGPLHAEEVAAEWATAQTQHKRPQLRLFEHTIDPPAEDENRFVLGARFDPDPSGRHPWRMTSLEVQAQLTQPATGTAADGKARS